ncbi:MAG: hypothetical protein AAF514_24970 [Verrucomicrobiota bacterium]
MVPIVILTGCGTTGGSFGGSNHPALLRRQEAIRQEPRGDYYIGRRYFVQGGRFWGYLRRPGEPWTKSKMIVINESRRRTPDRLPEAPKPGSPGHGMDHNTEYRISGYFSGDQVYEPNANLILPEFVLTNYQVLNKKPGFLFHPHEKYHPRRLPKRDW